MIELHNIYPCNIYREITRVADPDPGILGVKVFNHAKPYKTNTLQAYIYVTARIVCLDYVKIVKIKSDSYF